MEKTVREILKSLGIECGTLVKSSIGFTFSVYFIDDKFVMKIAPEGNRKLQKEILVYRNLQLPFVPEMVASGNFDGNLFLITKKVNGFGLYHLYHKFSIGERKKVLLKLAEIFNAVHGADFRFLDPADKKEDWCKFIEENFKKALSILKSRGINSENLFEISKRLPEIFAENKITFLHNDFHFDNLIYDGEDLFLIDYDRAMAGAIDYDLMIFKMMIEEPKKFANEEDEKFVDEGMFSDILQVLEENCPEMWVENIDLRLEVYIFIYKVFQAEEYSDIEKMKTSAKRLMQSFGM